MVGKGEAENYCHFKSLRKPWQHNRCLLARPIFGFLLLYILPGLEYCPTELQRTTLPGALPAMAAEHDEVDPFGYAPQWLGSVKVRTR